MIKIISMGELITMPSALANEPAPNISITDIEDGINAKVKSGWKFIQFLGDYIIFEVSDGEVV